MRKEFTKVHDRYTELLKVHMDHVERTRGLLGTDRLDGVGPTSRSVGMNSWNLNVNLTPPQMTRYLENKHAQLILLQCYQHGRCYLTFNRCRSTGPLSFGFTSLENASAVTPSNSKFFSNPVADLASSITTPASLSQPNALQSEMVFMLHIP